MPLNTTYTNNINYCDIYENLQILIYVLNVPSKIMKIMQIKFDLS